MSLVPDDHDHYRMEDGSSSIMVSGVVSAGADVHPVPAETLGQITTTVMGLWQDVLRVLHATDGTDPQHVARVLQPFWPCLERAERHSVVPTAEVLREWIGSEEVGSWRAGVMHVSVASVLGRTLPLPWAMVIGSLQEEVRAQAVPFLTTMLWTRMWVKAKALFVDSGCVGTLPKLTPHLDWTCVNLEDGRDACVVLQQHSKWAGTFDVVVLAGAMADHHDPSLLRQAMRVLGHKGVLMVADRPCRDDGAHRFSVLATRMCAVGCSPKEATWVVGTLGHRLQILAG